MKRNNLFMTVLLFTGCLTVATPEMVTTETKPITSTMEITPIDYSNYYGANLLQFPAGIRKWVVEDFTREDMSWMENPKLNLWWGDDGKAYVEILCTVGEGQIESFGGGSYGYNWYELIKIYGEYAAKFQTLKFKHQLKVEAEQRIQNDVVFAEIIEFAKQICDELEYDWNHYFAYKGNTVKQTPGKKHVVCSGYASEFEKVLQLKSVKSVQLWAAPQHAWNVLILEDGRTLYVDTTWFDNQYINPITGEITQLDDYNWSNITFDKEIFTYSGIGYSSGEFTHAFGQLVKEIIK